MGYQQVVLLGNLGRDPELRYLEDGKAVCNLRLAVNDRFTTDVNGVQTRKTLWVDVAVWGNQAEAVNQHTRKGDTVLVVGELKHIDGNPRLWQGSDGYARASFEVRAQTVQFTPNGRNGKNGNLDESVQAPPAPQGVPASGGAQVMTVANAAGTEEDEIPF